MSAPRLPALRWLLPALVAGVVAVALVISLWLQFVRGAAELREHLLSQARQQVTLLSVVIERNALADPGLVGELLAHVGTDPEIGRAHV